MKFRVEPFLWLAFSGGGVMAAIFLPVLVVLCALALPLGWVDADYAHLAAVLANPITFLVLLGLFAMMLVHAAHRFRFTLYDGLQVKHRAVVATVCYGGAVVGVFVALQMLGSAT